MKLFRQTLGVVLFAAAACSQAVTLKYELVNAHSFSNGSITFPGLDLNQAVSGVVTLEKSQESGVEVKSLELGFQNVKKLTATNFYNSDGNFFEAAIPNAWIYREIKVRVNSYDLANNNHLFIEGFVSNQNSFVTNNAPSELPLLFNLDGDLKDITPRKTADTTYTSIDGKRVTFTLKDRLGVAPADSNTSITNEGFVVDITWLGKGTKTVYLPAPITGPDRDFITAIAIKLVGTENPDINTWGLEVTFDDGHNNQMPAPPVNLLEVLNRAYPAM